MKDEDEDVGWLEARQKPVSNSFQRPVAVDEPTREAMLIIYFSTFLVALSWDLRDQTKRKQDGAHETQAEARRPKHLELREEFVYTRFSEVMD